MTYPKPARLGRKTQAVPLAKRPSVMTKDASIYHPLMKMVSVAANGPALSTYFAHLFSPLQDAENQLSASSELRNNMLAAQTSLVDDSVVLEAEGDGDGVENGDASRNGEDTLVVDTTQVGPASNVPSLTDRVRAAANGVRQQFFAAKREYYNLTLTASANCSQDIDAHP